MTMTDKQKMRVNILSNLFVSNYKGSNPYIRGGEVWRNWYSAHPMSEPIPKELLPTEEEMREFDRRQAIYIAKKLLYDRQDFDTLMAFGESVLGKPTEAVVWEIIARARPCGCKEAQCSFFCQYYGMENCYGEENL